MACGCPALVSSATCLPEICGPSFDETRHSGTALYFDPLNVEEITDGIRKLFDLTPGARDELVQRGRDHASAYTWERSAQMTLKVLDQALHEN